LASDAQQAAQADRRQAGLADSVVASLLGGSLAAAFGLTEESIMRSAHAWATQIRNDDILGRDGPRAAPDDEPALAVQRIARNPILCGGPVEHFSQHMPFWVPEPEDEEQFPIDVLYGRYDPITRSIEVFVNQIRQDAHLFQATEKDLIEIVRIHEHAHAVIHLGSRVDEVHKHLSEFGGGKKTDWSKFLEQRTSWFTTFPPELSEFLAQALTYATLLRLSASAKSERLQTIFAALELKQPPHYKLSGLVKQGVAAADWSLVLDVARGDVDALREQDFSPSAGLEALICSEAEQRLAADA
jgi:hypothetical protein